MYTVPFNPGLPGLLGVPQVFAQVFLQGWQATRKLGHFFNDPPNGFVAGYGRGIGLGEAAGRQQEQQQELKRFHGK
jgi:hypothetical protein